MTITPAGDQRRWRVLLLALMAAVVFAVFTPALGIFISGDDFEWIYSTYDLLDDPMLSFETNNHFFRPLIKWTYLGDFLVFGQVGAGYAATNLLIHFLNSAMLFALMRRRLKNPLMAAGTAAAFALSPLHSEGVLWAAGRPDTVLLTCWLAALLLLDHWCDRPGMSRAVAFTGVALLGIGAKESWIVFPFLATAYVVWVRRESIISGFRRTAGVWVAWLAYVAIFLILPAMTGRESATHYAEFAIVPALAKTSTTLLGYLSFGWFAITGWPALALSGTIVVGALVWLVRTENRFGLWSLLWLAATLALVAPFPMSVLRHNYLPLAGFWMLIAAAVDRSLADLRHESTLIHRRSRVIIPVAAVLIVLAVEGFLLQREIVDYRLYGDLHTRLCLSFAVVEPEISREKPIVLVDRSTFRGVEFMTASVQGGDKTFFVRRDALWQLVFLPQLADFMGRPFEERLVPVDPTSLEIAENGCTVLLFDDLGFRLRPDLEASVMTALAAGNDHPPGIGVYRYQMQ